MVLRVVLDCLKGMQAGCREKSEGREGVKNTYCIDMFMVRAISLRREVIQSLIRWAFHYLLCLDGLGRHWILEILRNYGLLLRQEQGEM